MFYSYYCKDSLEICERIFEFKGIFSNYKVNKIEFIYYIKEYFVKVMLNENG